MNIFAFHFSEPTFLSTCLLHDEVTYVSIYLCCNLEYLFIAKKIKKNKITLLNILNQFICAFIVVTVTDCVVSPATLLREEGSGSVCIVQLSLSPTFLINQSLLNLYQTNHIVFTIGCGCKLL